MIGGLDFKGMVPGFDFLQNLMKGAQGAGALTPGLAPGFGQWVAPTLDPAELDKRIQELRTVQFWLEQNAKLLGATIQAMEVQRMTLATLQTMNLPMADLRHALSIQPAPVPPRAKPVADAESAAKPDSAAAAVDPVQWWGALTQQFTEIANQAIQAGATAGAGAAEAPVAPAAKKKAAAKLRKR